MTSLAGRFTPDDRVVVAIRSFIVPLRKPDSTFQIFKNGMIFHTHKAIFEDKNEGRNDGRLMTIK